MSESHRIGSVSLQEIRELFDGIGAIGAGDDGGCERLAFSPAERQARQALAEAGTRLGLIVRRDSFASTFLVLEGREPQLPPVLTGSHLDTVPAGGCFDGAAGVLCGLAALSLIRRAGVVPKRPLALVSWVNEEGARFSPAMMGSGVFTGELRAEALRGQRDRSGVSLGEELDREVLPTEELNAGDSAAATGAIPTPAYYLELHPEQGRLLEQAGVPVGIVEGVFGQVAGDWEIRGRADHAGSTPMDDRADALVAAGELVAAVAELAAGEPPGVATVGELAVPEGARNVVPGIVRGTLDIRHPEDTGVLRIEERILSRARKLAERRACSFHWSRAWQSRAVRFDPELTAMLEDAAKQHGIGSLRLASAAGHDAVRLSRVCPSAMLFVPSRDGISHSPREHTAYEDLASGATLLADALIQLSER